LHTHQYPVQLRTIQTLGHLKLMDHYHWTTCWPGGARAGTTIIELQQAPLSLNYVPGLEEPEQALLSSDYVPGLEEPEQAPPTPVYLPYVPELVYWKYMPLEDDVFPAEEQPLPVAATPTADSLGYIIEFDPNGDPDKDEEEDPEEDHADSTVVALPAVDHVPSKEVTEPLPQIPSPPLPIPSPPPDSPTHIEISKNDRSQLRGRVNLLYRDRPVHRHLAVMVEREAANRRRQGAIKELLAAGHKRLVQLTKAVRLLKGLQTQMIEFQRYHGPAKGPAQPDAPGEADSSS
nr:hypothetical protein [Tanacetum cinerariifolium]